MDPKNFEAALRIFVEGLKEELQSLRTNRPSPKMVEDIRVDYYGQPTPIKQLGSISVVPPREIDITVWDKNVVNAVAKAVETSNLKLPANVDGMTIRLNLPQLTEERKKELEKVVRKIAEEARIKVRSARDEANKLTKKMEEEKKLSEDAAFKQRNEAQKLTDKANQDIEALLVKKIAEIFE